MSSEYGYLSYTPSSYSFTSVYGNVITPTEDITISGMRALTNASGTAKLRLGTMSDIIEEITNVTLVANEWAEGNFQSSIQLTANTSYIIQVERTGGSSGGGIGYTQSSGNVSINSKIINNGSARYGSFPGNSENGVWVGVDIIIDTTPPTPPPPPGPGFDIILMNNTEELNKIQKTPTTVRTLHGYLREQTDIVDPEIMIEYEGTLTDCNYMYIQQLSRYYFITKIDSVRTCLWRIYAHCDVLKTYAEGILATEAVVARNEKRYNLMLNDSMFKVYSNPRLQIANFPQKFTGESYILVMNGAQYTES